LECASLLVLSRVRRKNKGIQIVSKAAASAAPDKHLDSSKPRAEGPNYTSLGQRPRFKAKNVQQGLKARSINRFEINADRTSMERAYSPYYAIRLISWGVAPGWY